MNVIEINSLDVPEVAVYAHLTEAQLRSRLEPEKGVFIVESEKVIRVALAAGWKPLSFLAERKYLDTQVRPMLEGSGEWRTVPVYTAEREVLAGLTGYALTRGVLCAMRRPVRMPSVEEVIGGEGDGRRRRVVVLDGVVNSENTGAIFRAAAALGMDAVLLTRTCCDPLNRRACRVSMGTVFQVPWTWLESYDELRRCGYKTVAMALTDRSVGIGDPVLREPERLAIIMGTEGDGLSDEVLRSCDYVAKIPMRRGVDSLNVAAAAAVAFYQLG
ncbi:MAG: RNA methyltransferase [Bacteroidales bacterium]|nr:RNA methyltransferase [Bacteroidales bacterium]